MTLAEYLKVEDLSDAEFGKQIGRSRQTVYRLRTRKIKKPDPDTATAIVKVSGGKVTLNTLYGIRARVS